MITRSLVAALSATLGLHAAVAGAQTLPAPPVAPKEAKDVSVHGDTRIDDDFWLRERDSHVPYWEPAKYVAKLRTLKTDDCPLLLHVNLGAGHGGASGRFDRLKDQALGYTFMLDQWGMTQ